MTHSSPFALPPVSGKTTRFVLAANDYVHEQVRMRSDPRNIIKGLVKEHGASLTYPNYRTALRCCGIYGEAATSCGLATAQLLLASYTEKAQRYLREAGGSDLFAIWEPKS